MKNTLSEVFCFLKNVVLFFVLLFPFQGVSDGFGVMDLSKRVSQWSVEEVLEWVQDQYPTHMNTLQKAIIKHAISGTTPYLHTNTEFLSNLWMSK